MSNPSTVARIIDEAMDLFATRGYYSTSMQDIASAVGMRPSSLYNHVSSKHDLLASIMITAMNNMLNAHGRALAKANTPTEQLAVSMAAHVAFHAEHKREVVITGREINHLNAPERSALTQSRRDYVSRWVDIIRRGTESGEFSCTEPQLTAFALIDMGIGIATWFNPSHKHSIEHFQQLYVDIALKSVGSKT